MISAVSYKTYCIFGFGKKIAFLKLLKGDPVMKSSADTFITTIQKYNNPNNNYTGADSEEDDNDDD